MVAIVGTTAEQYQASWESLEEREIPQWFQDAKFGIFIHWGIYAVPGFAPRGQYAEWYWNWLGVGPNGILSGKDQVKPNETLQYHLKTFGPDVQYHDFARMFKAELFKPEQWAEIFRRAGAKYVVLTSKHHDGFCLFPSEEANRSWGRPWNAVDIGPERDLLGDLAEAVREAGLKFGFYYSLYEWYNPLWLTNRAVYRDEHMIPQFKDVVTRYQPSIIFADGEWDEPSTFWKSEELIAWLYNETPMKDEVVVNDRWGKETRHQHGDYYTTEYASGMADAKHPWEENRGMGHSYGINRNESLRDYRSGRELILMFVDLVSRGGNLLLNVGPNADGTIPVIMEERLTQMGNWLEMNGEAIYGTRPWRITRQWSTGDIPQVEYGGQYMVKYDINEVTQKPKDGRAVVEAFFTAREDHVYAITPRWLGERFVLREMQAGENTEITLLGYDEPLQWEMSDEGIVVYNPKERKNVLERQDVWAYRITGLKQ